MNNDTEPNTMPVLRARQATPATPAREPESATEALDIEMRRAQAISNAVQALPPAYQKQPGAVLLVDQWARRHGIDTLTAMSSVSFVKGRPVVDASMQRALATQAGYDVDITEGDGWAEVTVARNGRSRSARFTIEEARTAGLLGKDNWKNYTTDMLVARATARCLRRHAPEVVLGLSDPDEIDTPMDVLHAAAIAQPADEALEDDDEPAADNEAPFTLVTTRVVSHPHGSVRRGCEAPPATVAPKPVPAKAEPIEAAETEPVFKARIRSDYPGWTVTKLLKALGEAGHTGVTIAQVLADKTIYLAALDILEGEAS